MMTLVCMAIMYSLIAISVTIIIVYYILVTLSMDLILLLMIVNLQVLIVFSIIIRMYYYQYLIKLCHIIQAMINKNLMDIQIFNNDKPIRKVRFLIFVKLTIIRTSSSVRANRHKMLQSYTKLKLTRRLED